MSQLLHHNLMNAARRFPDKTAVVCDDDSISYRELDSLSDKLALTLAENCVRPGDRVAIFMNKSVPSIISIHGILKAGAVYVPLDPHAPLSRLGYILQNCDVKCLLTSSRRAEDAVELLSNIGHAGPMILTDQGSLPPSVPSAVVISWEKVVTRKEARLQDISHSGEDLAYILYTSGSTGAPKGVMISHLNSLAFVNWCCETFKFSPEDRVSNHAPLHFDLSILDIFATFGAGATLYLVPERLAFFPFRLSEWIATNEISIWYSVPSVLSMMVLNGELERFRFEQLDTILFAGEVFPVKYLRTLMSLIPHARFYNLYGPTETNVITWYDVPRLSPTQLEPVPIGKACAYADLFAMTDDTEIVTRPGEVGELFSGGCSVAQGYWGDPEKTNLGFVTDPRRPNAGAIAYKTGDLVTLDEAGNYVFLGRQDHMIKSRGYRIELGEIETALYRHSDVKEAAVVAIPDEVIGNRLVAFVVMDPRAQADSASLRDFCSKSIPRYMVPETIIFQPSLPKTSTGKIDRPALATQVHV